MKRNRSSCSSHRRGPIAPCAVSHPIRRLARIRSAQWLGSTLLPATIGKRSRQRQIKPSESPGARSVQNAGTRFRPVELFAIAVTAIHLHQPQGFQRGESRPSDSHSSTVWEESAFGVGAAVDVRLVVAVGLAAWAVGRGSSSSSSNGHAQQDR